LLEALEIFRETGAAGRYGWTLSNLGTVYEQRDELGAAEKAFQEAVSGLRRTHEQGYLVEAERLLAGVLVRQGKIGEAERIVTAAERRVGRDDVWTRASMLHVSGLVRAAQGRRDEACEALSAALEIIEPTMYTILAKEIRDSLEALRAGAAAPAPT
jgi:ATP/maltotriose-dependent transcriptional regulator MalT